MTVTDNMNANILEDEVTDSDCGGNLEANILTMKSLTVASNMSSNILEDVVTDSDCGS